VSEQGTIGAFDLCKAVLRHRPSGLFTDIDGTISEIAPRPELARVEERAQRALIELASQIDVVGAITGRAPEDGQRLLGTADLAVVGNHGFERIHGDDKWVHPGGSDAVAAVSASIAAIRDRIEGVAELRGVVLEDKRVSGSIHYRETSDPLAAEQLLRPIVQEVASTNSLRMTQGKMVLELRPPAIVNKGTAIRQLTTDYDLQGVVFLGDDVTDVDAFHALHDLQSAGYATATIAVIADDTPTSVRESADASVMGVAGCIELIEQLVDAFNDA
jgi:trehalose 6-phosphate phosphatase